MDTKLQESIEYLSQYISVTPVIQEKIVKHAKRYNIAPEICAWYSDWCEGCGYTRTEARRLLHGGKGEFMNLPGNLGMVRFAF